MHAALIAIVQTGFLLCNERIAFDATLAPQFTANQIRNSDEATRAGLAKWARTEHGKKLIEYFDKAEYAITVIENPGEDGVGRAPQPGIATLAAATDHTKLKAYSIVLNPQFFHVPSGMTTLLNAPATPADMMAAGWAGEMLHVYFYSLGISLPHHPRTDFQDEWWAVANELGLALLSHDDGDEHGPSRGRVVRFRSVE